MLKLEQNQHKDEIMCLAIYKPANVEVPQKHLRNGFENHPDGAGLAWANNGVLHLRKGIFNIDEVIKQYEAVKQYHCLIHFRKATHGKVDATNCHPFLFNDNKLALVHNGILPIKCSIDGLSDTGHFVKLVLEPLVKNYGVPINNGALNYLITVSIGTDKLAIMDGNGATYIFNESGGTWDEGVWYSNTTFRYGVYKPTTNYNSHSYSPNRNNTERNYSHSFNFRKHWDTTDDSGDDSYLEFWRQNVPPIVTIDTNGSQGCGVDASTPQNRKQLLLTDGRQTVDDAGNVIDIEEVKEDEEKTFSEGDTCEYGWFNAAVEADIKNFQTTLGISREEALIRIFNEK
jgi:glutamine amidotransferase